jgi:hypothetical protein
MDFQKTEQTNYGLIPEYNDESKANIYILYLMMPKIQLTSMFGDI